MTTMAIFPLLLAMASVAQTQQLPAPAAAATESDIVVQQLTDAAIARIVEALTQTSRGAQVSRWNDAICPRVLEIDPLHTALIEDRIAAVAKSLAIPVAAKPCAPSIVIVATPDADAFTRAILTLHPGLFGDPAYGIQHGGVIADLKASRPVRWIDATRTGGADGGRFVSGAAGFGGGSRIKRPTRENAVLSFVIVDIKQLSHITWGQLADYLSLVTLARPKLDAAPSDSVLSIFAVRDTGNRGPAGLTSTDIAMLHGLYHSDASLPAEVQRLQIERQMRKGSQP